MKVCVIVDGVKHVYFAVSRSYSPEEGTDVWIHVETITFKRLLWMKGYDIDTSGNNSYMFIDDYNVFEDVINTIEMGYKNQLISFDLYDHHDDVSKSTWLYFVKRRLELDK